MKKFKFNKNSIIATLAITAVVGITGLVIAATSVSLLTADSFAVLGGSGITNTATSTITGNIGSYPTVSISGFPPGVLVGTNHAGDAVTQSAKTDLTAAYNNAAGQTPVSTVPTELGSTTKYAGVYDTAAGTLGITGTLTLDAQGDPSAIFIFKAASTLTTASASVVSLINGAQACNVFWQIGSSATLGTGSNFKGSILAFSSITDNSGSTIEGRLLARNALVTLNNTIVTVPTCVLTPSVGRSTAPAALAPVPVVPPLINVTKIPSPLTLPLGGGSVTYTYNVTNIGTVPMDNVLLVDNKCSAVNFISGDTNNNSLLDINEAWIYRCTKVVSQTETNTATVRGFHGGIDAYDIAAATVVVGIPLPPPLIHLVKVPNTFLLPIGGGPVTYSYTVTNPGTAPLTDVSIIDDKCTGLPGRVVGHPGDLNQNNILESNETWHFTCHTNITQTTTNIGTAEGHANGLTAIDVSPATVVVTTPMLPNTGYGPENKSTIWSILIPTAVVALLLSLYIVRRKRTV